MNYNKLCCNWISFRINMPHRPVRASTRNGVESGIAFANLSLDDEDKPYKTGK